MLTTSNDLPVSTKIHYYLEERLLSSPDVVHYAWHAEYEDEILATMVQVMKHRGHQCLYRVYKTLDAFPPQESQNLHAL